MCCILKGFFILISAKYMQDVTKVGSPLGQKFLVSV